MTPEDRAREIVTDKMADAALVAWLSRPKGTKAVPAMREALVAAVKFALETNRIQ